MVDTFAPPHCEPTRGGRARAPTEDLRCAARPVTSPAQHPPMSGARRPVQLTGMLDNEKELDYLRESAPRSRVMARCQVMQLESGTMKGWALVRNGFFLSDTGSVGRVLRLDSGRSSSSARTLPTRSTTGTPAPCRVPQGRREVWRSQSMSRV